MSSPPETHYIPLQYGDFTAEISTLGGGLRLCEYRGQPLVDTYNRGDVPPLSSNIILAPWPNRTEDGRFTFNGVHYQLDITEPERNNAIHGFAGNAQWNVRYGDDNAAELACMIGPRPGWPWEIELSARYELTSTGLSVLLRATNRSDNPAPFALGIHTYLSLCGVPLDECEVSVPVDTLTELDPHRLLPTGVSVPVSESADFSSLPRGMALAGMQLDHCFRTTLAPGDVIGGMRKTVLRYRDADAYGRQVVMETSANLPWFQIFTTDPAAGCSYPGRGRALAVEPMSAPPNALRTGTDLLTLNPGESEDFSWRLYVEA